MSITIDFNQTLANLKAQLVALELHVEHATKPEFDAVLKALEDASEKLKVVFKKVPHVDDAKDIVEPSENLG